MSKVHPRDYENHIKKLEAQIEKLKQEAAWEVAVVYHFRGDIRNVCETEDDAAKFIDKQKEDESEFYTEVWPVKFYE